MAETPSLTPHQDAARATVREMRADLAGDLSDAGECGTYTRIVLAAIEAFCLAVAREEDAGADPELILESALQAAASLVETALRNAVDPEHFAGMADEAGQYVHRRIVLGLSATEGLYGRRVARSSTRARQ